MNTIEFQSRVPVKAKVKDLPGGTLVKWYAEYDYDNKPEFFVVVHYKNNSADIGAVSIFDGEYLLPDTEVEVLTKGETITITVSGEEKVSR